MICMVMWSLRVWSKYFIAYIVCDFKQSMCVWDACMDYLSELASLNVTLSTLWANSADDKSVILFTQFFLENRI